MTALSVLDPILGIKSLGLQGLVRLRGCDNQTSLLTKLSSKPTLFCWTSSSITPADLNSMYEFLELKQET